MKFESRYIEENVNVSRRDYGREFLQLGTVLLALTFSAYLILGFCAEQLTVHLPLKMEKALGAAFSRQLDEAAFSETRAYVQKVLDRLVAVSSGLPPFDYRVDIVDNEIVNAVALPAGRIVLFEGIVEKVNSEESLAMVLAHELGHYVHRDHLRSLGRGLVLMAIGMMFGTNGEVPGIVTPSVQVLDLSFSREHEQSADRFAIDTVFAAYGHVGGALVLYDILREKEGSRFFLPLFSTHPDTLQRKMELQNRIGTRRYGEGSATPLPGDGRMPFAGERAKVN